MSPLDAFSACAGIWRGTSKLQDPHAGIAAESPSPALLQNWRKCGARVLSTA